MKLTLPLDYHLKGGKAQVVNISTQDAKSEKKNSEGKREKGDHDVSEISDKSICPRFVWLNREIEKQLRGEQKKNTFRDRKINTIGIISSLVI